MFNEVKIANSVKETTPTTANLFMKDLLLLCNFKQHKSNQYINQSFAKGFDPGTMYVIS